MSGQEASASCRKKRGKAFVEELEQKGAHLSSLTQDDIDTIGEILNISMGSASTALSAMLDKQVVITPPKVTLEILSAVDYTALEPAILVRIQYVKGISGSNIMLFRQNDMQIILNLLMGTDEPPRDDFEFDELSMSAACEVMNQMMGSSATALSEVLATTVDISTPDAFVVSNPDVSTYVDVPLDAEVVAVSFGLIIQDVMSTNFASIMTADLAQRIIKQVTGDQAAEPPVQQAAPAPAAPAQAVPPQAAPAQAVPAPAVPAQAAPAPAVPPQAAPAPAVPAQAAQPQAMPQMQAPPQAAQAMPGQGVPGMPQMPAQPPMGGYPGYPSMDQQGMMNPYMGMPPGYMPYPPYPYPMPQAQTPPAQQEGQGMYTGMGVIKQPVNVQAAQFPNFSVQPASAAYNSQSSSMGLLMNVPLDVSVEIGKTKKKIKEILEFGQGTVIELEKQAGAPVEIVVNGQLIARGDVVVIEDNFGVRITEILGMKDLMESLENSTKS